MYRRFLAKVVFAISLIGGVLGVHVTGAPTAESQGCGKPCRDHPKLSGPCFGVRGRMNFANGAPSVRIWRVGTNRILGVSEGYAGAGYCNLPPDILGRLSWESDLFADFVVCPFEPSRPGVMQLVCVDSATAISVRPTKR